MNSLLIIHVAVSIIFGLLTLASAGSHAALSFAAGAAITFVNLATLVFSWPRILAKKLVALSIGVIVFKFAILGWILYIVVNTKYVHLGWFAGGLATVIVAVLGTSFQQTSKSAN